MAPPNVVVCFAPGFEEIEAVTIVDVLRRGGVAVTTAALDRGEWVVGAHDLAMRMDACLEDLPPDDFAMAVLPGGMPGSATLRDSALVRSFVRAVWERGGHACAICAAPIALHAAGLLQGRRAHQLSVVPEPTDRGHVRRTTRRERRPDRHQPRPGNGVGLLLCPARGTRAEGQGGRAATGHACPVVTRSAAVPLPTCREGSSPSPCRRGNSPRGRRRRPR